LKIATYKINFRLGTIKRTSSKLCPEVDVNEDRHAEL